MAYLYNGKLVNNKKEHTNNTFNNMDESQMHMPSDRSQTEEDTYSVVYLYGILKSKFQEQKTNVFAIC